MKNLRSVGSVAVLLCCAPALAAEWPELSSPPMAQGGGEDDAALVVGVEVYSSVPHVPGAARNAGAWYAYLTRTLKLAPERVTLLLDADATEQAVRSGVRDAAAQAKPGGTLWVVFIGHGASGDDGKDGWLLGADALPAAENVTPRGLRQHELFELLSKGRQGRTVAVLDACFAGGEPALPPNPGGARGRPAKTVVMTAGAGDQLGGPLPGVKRPAFSYLVLGALRGWADANRDGNVTAQEVVDYARLALQTTAKERRQTPSLAGDANEMVLGTGANERGPELSALVPAPRQPGDAPEVGSLSISARPTDGTALELTDPTGRTVANGPLFQNSQALAGKWKVVARAAGFQDVARQFEVAPDEATLVRLELKTLGGLKVTGRQPGAKVMVSGPGGFSRLGGLPLEVAGLKSGSYRVQVLQVGYEPWEQSVDVVEGKTTAAALPNDRSCPVGSAYLPAGTFKMGDRHDEVTVAEFCMDSTEVTVEAYLDCFNRGRCSAAQTASDCNAGKPERRIHPVNCVDWTQADAYCRAQGKRLPTEEEWEWAARGGPEARIYPWGNTEPEAEVCWDGIGNDLGQWNRTSTCVVGRHPAGDSPQGIHDLSGNVWEWTSGKEGTSRVFRGGCWSLDVVEPMRAAYRGWGDTSYQYFFLGFRCASSP